MVTDREVPKYIYSGVGGGWKRNLALYHSVHYLSYRDCLGVKRWPAQ